MKIILIIFSNDQHTKYYTKVLVEVNGIFKSRVKYMSELVELYLGPTFFNAYTE